jgi:hypothetical protein
MFTQSLIPSREAREQGIIPWDWIVDETRTLERVSTWDDPEQDARVVATSYRRDFWNQQPVRAPNSDVWVSTHDLPEATCREFWRLLEADHSMFNSAGSVAMRLHPNLAACV